MSKAKLRRQFLEISFNECCENSFTRILGMQNAKLISADLEKGVAFKFTVPKSLCIVNAKGPDPALATSAALALFDEISYNAFLMQDKTCRPGLSLQLSIEMLKDCPAGETVILKSRVEKAGKTIGFADMTMTDEKGVVIARGKHIKYLPMGILWDKMWNEKSLPYSLKYAIPYKDSFFKSTYVGKFLMEHMLGAPMNSLKGKEPGDELGAVFSYLGVNEVLDHSDSYEMSVSSGLCNLLGRMQGGALAMAVEQSAIMYHAADSRRRIVGMDVRYHGGSKGNVRIALRDDAHTQLNDPSQSLKLPKSMSVDHPLKKANLDNIYSGRLHPATSRRSPQVHGTVSTGNGVLAHFVCNMSQ